MYTKMSKDVVLVAFEFRGPCLEVVFGVTTVCCSTDISLVKGGEIPSLRIDPGVPDAIEKRCDLESPELIVSARARDKESAPITEVPRSSTDIRCSVSTSRDAIKAPVLAICLSFREKVAAIFQIRR